jgi:hypothetical protein
MQNANHALVAFRSMIAPIIISVTTQAKASNMGRYHWLSDIMKNNVKGIKPIIPVSKQNTETLKRLLYDQNMASKPIGINPQPTINTIDSRFALIFGVRLEINSNIDEAPLTGTLLNGSVIHGMKNRINNATAVIRARYSRLIEIVCCLLTMPTVFTPQSHPHPDTFG